MTALTADRFTDERKLKQIEPPVAAATELFAGGLTVLDASGDAEPGSVAVGKTCVGKCFLAVDNTGAAGAKTTKTEFGTFKWLNDGTRTIVVGDEGKLAYIEDDQTVGILPDGRSPAGVIVQIDDSTHETGAGVWVHTPAPDNASGVGGVDVALTVLASDLVAANTEVFRVVSPVAGKIKDIYTSLGHTVLAGGDAVLTGKIGAVAITTGVITIAQASALADVDQATPTAANVVARGDVISFTVSGANTEVLSTAVITIVIGN